MLLLATAVLSLLADGGLLGGVRSARFAQSKVSLLATTAGGDELAFRVRDAILDEEERPYVLWSEDGPKPLKINLDLLNWRARELERRRDVKPMPQRPFFFPAQVRYFFADLIPVRVCPPSLARQVDGARKTFEYCCSLDPNDGRAWIARARLQEKDGLPENAEALLKEGLQWEPSSAYLLQAYGSLQERRGKGDEALELYAAAVRGDPRHAPAWVASGLLLERRRQHDAAATCLLMAKSVAPKSYFVWQVIGEWHKRRGELSSAREAYRRSLQQNPRNAATFHAWGVLEWRCGHQELATQVEMGMQHARDERAE